MKYFCYGLFIAIIFIGSGFMDAQAQHSDSIRTEHRRMDFTQQPVAKEQQGALLSNRGLQIADGEKSAVWVSESMELPLKDPQPFLALGSRWREEIGATDSLLLEVRTSEDEAEWSGWIFLEKDPHLTETSDTFSVGQLLFFPAEVRFIQLRITLHREDLDSNPRFRDLTITFTSPGATPARELDRIRQKSVGKAKPSDLPEGADYPMPGYVSRTEWGCPDGQDPSGPVSSTTVTHMIVHHSAGTNSSSDWPAVVRSIWDYHVNTNGWSDIGYNWLVDPQGVVYQGRGWLNGNDEVTGAHFCGANSNTMGICLLGNFEETDPATLATGALVEMLAWKADERDIDPLGMSYHNSSGLTLDHIAGHRDGCSTACPGVNLYADLPQIRENVDSKTGAEEAIAELPVEVSGNYPNPFAGSTHIPFRIEEEGEVRITVWDTAGRLVEEVVRQRFPEGEHEQEWEAAGHAAGVYIFRVEFKGSSLARKMILLH
jgi:hypothetical protein